MSDFYTLYVIVIYFIIIGILIGLLIPLHKEKSKKNVVDDDEMIILGNDTPLQTFDKSGPIHRPTAEDIEERNKPQRLKDEETEMTRLLDKLNI